MHITVCTVVGLPAFVEAWICYKSIKRWRNSTIHSSETPLSIIIKLEIYN